MNKHKWSWLPRLAWLMFFIVTIFSIMAFLKQPFISSLNYPQTSLVLNIPIGTEIINIWGLFMCILTIISALIGAATISMIESIYVAIAKQTDSDK